jgi:hypothetical protein
MPRLSRKHLVTSPVKSAIGVYLTILILGTNASSIALFSNLQEFVFCEVGAKFLYTI